MLCIQNTSVTKTMQQLSYDVCNPTFKLTQTHTHRDEMITACIKEIAVDEASWSIMLNLF